MPKVASKITPLGDFSVADAKRVEGDGTSANALPITVIAGGAAYLIPVCDATGAYLTSIPIGMNGEILTSGGAGALPSFKGPSFARTFAFMGA